ncbi:hypothetical protein C0992_003705 [Termitomyces sp. T32_za158]|nr:hypothetical protein C0992_003705 [Termitomyces sp. T32_za158]
MMLVVGIIRRGAFTSMVAVELAVLTVLWVLYLAAGARTAEVKDELFPFGCNAFELNLFLYTVTLLVFAFIGQSRGNAVWTASVNEASFLAQPVGVPVYNPAAPAHVPVYAPQQYPMVQQQMGPAPGQGGMPQI